MNNLFATKILLNLTLFHAKIIFFPVSDRLRTMKLCCINTGLNGEFDSAFSEVDTNSKKLSWNSSLFARISFLGRHRKHSKYHWTSVQKSTEHGTKNTP